MDDNEITRVSNDEVIPVSYNSMANDIETDLELSEEVPSIRKILAFALPAIGVYLCSPLLSMIDTSSVGLFCGTLQQAALNPAVTISDYSARTMSFLYTGTTNMIASSKKSKSENEIKDAFMGSLRLSALLGASLGLFLILTSQRMLVPLVGNSNIEAEVLHSAYRYVAIRSLGMPAAAMIGTSQSACLGLEDNKTPFRVILIMALINLVLDMVLVGRSCTWLGGTAGVAWATTIAQYSAVALFFRTFMGKSKRISNRNGLKTSTNGLLTGRMSKRNFFKLPSKKTIEEFKPYVVPVTTTQIGRCSIYVAQGHVVSSTLNACAMAAQQIITSIFYALIPIGDSCSLTAQSFLPPIVVQEPSEKRTNAVRKTMKNIFRVASGMGLVLAMIAASIPLASVFLTTDPAVRATVSSVVPIMIALFSTHGIFCAAEGSLLGFKDLKFLGRIYGLFFAVIPFLMLQLKYAARAGQSVTLRSVW
eukprot:CAMPEP_0183733442 /NCGR_PEP_ID=MMETSP0737-20130205/41200_1 /TAXON_ID=385413 /ORGANISM="Thalassiosira miniscula, Strain CCMP1093" /LENGTH=476 /DNA_ID=CAMNT_0025966695 /DNA_START=114 /DNA_END=1541 /DNA_ORIENTATION=+